MKIAIIGYGKMGKEIQKQAQALSIEVSRVIDQKDDLSKIDFEPDEVAIEFTTPDACLENIKQLLTKNVPTVCGTTGWYDQIDQVKKWVTQFDGCFLYASNFSIGVHLFWKALTALSKQMQSFDNYCVHAKEIHHVHKKDTPSGTMKTCQDIVTQNMPRVSKLETQSIREGEVFGDHHIYFESTQDILELSHKAKNRSGFATGALTCAQWLVNQKGFLTIDDYLQEVL